MHMDNVEWKTRVDLAAAFRLVDLYGWSDMLAYAFMLVSPDQTITFSYKPYGCVVEEITASDLIKLDVDGNILSDTSRSINPAGYTIHSAIHIGRKDAKLRNAHPHIRWTWCSNSKGWFCYRSLKWH